MRIHLPFSQMLNDTRNEPVRAVTVFLISNPERIRQDAFFFDNSPEVGRNDGDHDNDSGDPIAYGHGQTGKAQ